MAADIIENKKVASPDLWEIKIDFACNHVLVQTLSYLSVLTTLPEAVPKTHGNFM